jgi:hypothetical protein
MQAIRSFAAGWISTCRESHADCGPGGIRSNTGTSTLPTRVIDLESSDGPRLFITKEASTDLRSQPYTALSHCWGAGARHLTTTQANLEQMVRRIPMGEMPQTYLDAFKVNQSLGVRYIWIDALCIVQDDRHDWQVESAKMCDIYRDAYCTIAANAAQSNNQGCFMEKHGLSLPIDSCRLVAEENGHRSVIVLLPPRPSWKNQILSSPVNSRAWVLQERLISPRILHFAKDAIFWECSELKSSQFEPNGIPDVELLADPVSYIYTFRNPTAAECARSAWLQLVQHYTKLGITKVEDRLPALSGLAKMIQAKTQDTYVAGLWKSSLMEGLTWALSGKDFKSEELHNKRPYTAPSWSWASTDRDLGFLTVTDMTKPIGSAKSAADWDWTFDVEILSVSIQLAGPDPTGQVSRGSITLSGHIHILPVVTTRSLPVGSTDQIDPGNLERPLQPGIEAKGSANFIHLDYPKDPSIASFPALRLCHRSPSDQTQTCLLVLEATGEAPNQYKRIGRAVLYGLAPVTELGRRVIELV